MRFFKHLSYRTLFTKAVMGISVICLFASDGLTVSAIHHQRGEHCLQSVTGSAVQCSGELAYGTGDQCGIRNFDGCGYRRNLICEKYSSKGYPASTTKILTTLIASERCSMDEIVDFSYDAVHDIDPGSNHIAIEPGEQLTMEECLNAILTVQRMRSLLRWRNISRGRPGRISVIS